MSSITAHQCCITYETMTDPVIDNDGHTYERSAIEQWLRIHSTSPITRRPMLVGELRPNRAVLNAISELNDAESVSSEIMPDATIAKIDTQVTLRTCQNTLSSPFPNSQCTVEIEDVQSSGKKIVFVLDTSGSMCTLADPPGNESTGLTRLDVAKHAILTCVSAMRPCDEVSIVTFSNSAKVVFPMRAMTVGGKALVKIELLKISVQGATNIWDGIKTGLDQIPDNFQGSTFLLTDGCPNVIPPKGHLRMLREYMDKRPQFDAVLHTFGFGYQLDSELLYELANETQGSYAFIPDIGMVGTVFVHRMANELVTYLDKAWLLIETAGEIKGLPSAEKTSWGYSVPIGPLCHGQPRHVFFQHSEDVHVTVKTSHWSKEANIVDEPLQSNDRQVVALGIIDCWKLPGKIECINRICSQITNTDLKKDLVGQVTEAVETQAFQKWGKHFLPSIAMAHWRQNCNNFRDPGVQRYGGKTFQEMRDRLDELFDNLEPPVPENVPKNTDAVPLSMASYNNASGPCFTGDCLVQMANGTKKPCSEIRMGDMVATTKGPGKMRCVIKTPCKKVNIVEYRGLQVTQWHPILVNGVWSFPIYEGDTIEMVEVDIYSFLLEPGFQDMLIGNQIPCITLGHGIENDPVATHPFYGSEQVVEAMRQMKGFEEGSVVLTSGVIVDVETNVVCGFNN